MRVIQERELRRVGGTTAIPVHFRLVCATHRNLSAAVKAGTFREDLYARINVLEIDLPPLRQRLRDIPAIAQEALRKLRGKQRDRTLTLAALEKLQGQLWPGNVRQLLNVLRRAVANTDSTEIDAKDLEIQTASELRGAAAQLEELPDDLRADGEARERALCERTLRTHHGNLAATARSLKISPQALRRRLRKYGLL